jgi:hypothetical protein
MDQEHTFWRIKDWSFDIETGVLERDGHPERLDQNEARLLTFLIRHYSPEPKHTNEQIRWKVWGRNQRGKGSLNTSASKLAKILGGGKGGYIRSRPYQLAAPPEPILIEGRGFTAVERIAGSLLRHCKGGHASTIRLFGTADTYVMPEDLVIHYHHDQSYKIPDDLRHDAEIRIREKKTEAKEKNKVFFNGPNVSLIHWTASPPENGAEARIERNTLELHLAPVGWFDFEGANGLIAERLDPDRPETYEPWVNLRAMTHDFSPRHSRLSNMLCNTITIFTPDGQVGYGKRRGRQSTVPSMLSCAIAENVNRFFDETDRKDYKRLINSFAYSMKASDCPGNDYDPPVGWPHPAATVRRGINEESSQHMMDHVLDLGIKVTGIDFGLDILHPFLLWIVLVDLTAEEFMRECAIDPGKDSHEAEIKFVPADFEAAETKSLLVRKDWVPGGKASFVRALQLIDAVKTQKTMPATKAFDILAAAR